MLRVFVANSLTTACSSTTRTLAVIGSARRRKPTSKSTICKLLSLYLLILLCQIESVIIFNPVFSLSLHYCISIFFFFYDNVCCFLFILVDVTTGCLNDDCSASLTAVSTIDLRLPSLLSYVTLDIAGLAFSWDWLCTTGQ